MKIRLSLLQPGQALLGADFDLQNRIGVEFNPRAVGESDRLTTALWRDIGFAGCTKGTYRRGLGPASNTAGSYSYNGPNRTRSRMITIPNVGGFAEFSLRFLNAKVSVGYHGDFFFGAIDSGIDTHQSSDEKF